MSSFDPSQDPSLDPSLFDDASPRSAPGGGGSSSGGSRSSGDPGRGRARAGGFDVVAAVRHQVDTDVSSLDRSGVRRSLAELRRVESWVEARKVAHVRRLKELSGDDPVVPPGSDVAGATGGSRREGEKAVRRADELADKPAVEAALAAGQLNGDHVDAMSRATRGLDDDTKSALAGDGGADLVEAAAGRSPEQLEREIRRRARALTAGDGGDGAEFERQRRGNRLRWWIDPDTGMVRLSGTLDPLNGQRVTARLERLVRRYMAGEPPDTAPDDPRERSDHYRALALFHLINGTGPVTSVDAAESGADADAGTPGGPASPPSPPRAPDVPGAPGPAGPPPPSGTADPAGPTSPPGSADPAGPTSPPGPTGSPGPTPSPGPAAPPSAAAAPPSAADPIDLVGGGVDLTLVIDLETILGGLHDRSIIDAGHPNVRLPIATILRLACEADIVPVVLDGRGVPLHVGRSRRLATAGQRRALRAVYPTCAIDGCTVPVAICQPHHIEWWRHGGRTDLPNLIPLCSRHHHAAHEGGWRLHLDPATRILTTTHPDGTRRRHPPPRAPDTS